jgi:copper(I)-binding protein
MGWLAALALAAGTSGTPIVLELPIVRFASEAGEHVGGYIRIRNTGPEPDRLVEIACTCSRASEIHSTAGEGMTTLPALDIPAGGTVEIRPGSDLHLMLEAVGPIAAGSEVELTLRFERGGAVTQRFAVVADTFAAWPPAP